MKKSIAVLKGYFKTGDKPTQQQFYDFLESFLHLDSYILASQVSGLEEALTTLEELGISDVAGLQTALNDLNTAITTLEIADVSGLQGILDTLAVVSIGDVTGLQAVLDDLATRGIADIRGLSDALNGKVDKVAGYGLSQNDFSNYYTGLITTIQNAVTALTYEGVVVEATIIKTLDLTDVNKRIKFTNANPIALTVPLDASVAWYTGTKIKGTVQGNGAVTISGAGITFIGNTLTFPKGESFVLINTALNEWTVEGNAPTAGALVYKTWFVNTATGNNTTGLYQDSSKPFATIDFVLALPALANGDIIFLQNNRGVFPINAMMPEKTLIFKSDLAITIDFSGNTNTNLFANTAVNPSYFFDIPKGTFKNERSGGAGCYWFNNASAFFVKIVANTIYVNTSNAMLQTANYTVDAETMQVRTSFVNNHFGYNASSRINVNNFNCLVNNATANISNQGFTKINVITGAGSYLFLGKTEVGDILCTGASNCYAGARINFFDSVITANLNIGADGYGNNVLSGNIESCPQISHSSITQHGTMKLVNFSGNFGAGSFNPYNGTFIIENSSVKCNGTLFNFNNQGNGTVTIRNSTIEMVTPAPLCTAGASEVRTVKIQGLSTNATVISTGVGVTVTQMTNY